MQQRATYLHFHAADLPACLVNARWCTPDSSVVPHLQASVSLQLYSNEIAWLQRVEACWQYGSPCPVIHLEAPMATT